VLLGGRGGGVLDLLCLESGDSQRAGLVEQEEIAFPPKGTTLGTGSSLGGGRKGTEIIIVIFDCAWQNSFFQKDVKLS